MIEKGQKSLPIYIDHTPHTPLGTLWVAAADSGLWALDYQIDRQAFLGLVHSRGTVDPSQNQTITAPILEELTGYLLGQRQHFTFPIDWTGMTPFQVEVRKAVMAIPYGHTSTYGQIAASLGKPGAARAVGRANATNPIPLVIPCHRLIGADGSLRGYGGAGGIKTKQWLLDLERINSI
jgi:methylated-DNA-[protein]-cysteine S-methyltransferase